MLSAEVRPTICRKSACSYSECQLTILRYINYKLLSVVVKEAMRNEPFYDAIKAVMTVPGDQWSSQMYDQLRTRLEVTIARFDRSSSNVTNPFDVVNTSRRLEGLIKALKSMAKPSNWEKMRSLTRLQYFGLVLDVLRYVVASDRDHRTRPTSGGSSPYAVAPPMNHNLYQRMVCTSQCANATILLRRLFAALGAHIDAVQAEQIRKLLSDVRNKDRSSQTVHSEHFVDHLSLLRDGKSIIRMRHLLHAN
jgi:hypothetical protein